MSELTASTLLHPDVLNEPYDFLVLRPASRVPAECSESKESPDVARRCPQFGPRHPVCRNVIENTGYADSRSFAMMNKHRRAATRTASVSVPRGASGVTEACSVAVRSHEVRRSAVISGSVRKGCCSTAIWQIQGALRNGGCSRRAFLPASCA
jgi:hypothetical protein